MKSLRTIGKVLVRNSPTLLTGLSVAGLLSTAVLAVRATPKALDIIGEEQCERVNKNRKLPFNSLTKKEIIKLTWKCYVPAALIGAATIACIIGANSINLKRHAALAGAYSLTAATLKEYQAKVVETLGEKKSHEIKEEIHKDKLRKTPVTANDVIVVGQGDALCFDVMSGRYFKSDYEKIRKAQNDLNRDLLSEMWISLNNVYDELGLPPIKMGEELGWAVNHSDIEFELSSQIADNGQPCLVIDYSVAPRADYQQL